MPLSRIFCSICLPAIALMLSIACCSADVPEDNLAYPVLITVDNGGSGSGVYLRTETGVFLVTAKHVVFDEKNRLRGGSLSLISYPKSSKDVGRNKITIDIATLEKNGHVKRHPSEDIVVVQIGEVDEKSASQGLNSGNGQQSPLGHGAVLPGVSKDEIAGPLVVVSAENTELFDNVVVGNDVMMFGYPKSLELIPNPKIDFDHPLLRKGIIAGINREKRAIILDCPVYQGDSGGPVIEMDHEGLGIHFRLIGIVTQFIAFADTWRNEHFNYVNTTLMNSGYSLVVPIDFALELTK